MRKPISFDDWTISVGIMSGRSLDEISGNLVWADGTGLSIGIAGDSKQPIHTLRFWDLALARVSMETRQIELIPLSPNIPQETLDHFLLDQIFPRVASHAGFLVLHAGGVEIDGEAVAFLGASGLGKSTLVASLGQSGAALLSDDALVVSRTDGRFYCEALNPGLRLMPDSIACLFPLKPDLTAFAHYSPKQRIALPLPAAIGSRESPLAGLFFLGSDPSDLQITLRPMTASEACIGIISNSFSLDPTDLVHAHNKLIQASAMAADIPAFELSFPRDYARLPQVQSAVRDRIRSLANARPNQFTGRKD